MPLRNFSLCESAKLISPDKRCCRFPKGLGKIPAEMFSGFQITSPQQLDTQTLTTKNFLVGGHMSSTDRPSFWHIVGPHVMETLDMSQECTTTNLCRHHTYKEFSRFKWFCNSGKETLFFLLSVILFVSGPLPSSRGEKICWI